MASFDVIVVGGGPAGLMAAARAAQRGLRTLLLEKNRRPGVKILMAGGTRCNFTHATDAKGVVAAFGRQGRFLHSALAVLSPAQVVEFFAAAGVPSKVEEHGKVFPESDRASDILDALVRNLERAGAKIAGQQPLLEIEREGSGFRLVTATGDLTAAKLILATGGRSYPACGTAGDGYRWAEALGHTIVPTRTALVPIATHAPWVLGLQGITVTDVALKVAPAAEGPTPRKAAVLAQQRGSFLFTHFGASGPAVLDVSRAVSGVDDPPALALLCDFLPAVPLEELDELLKQECAAAGKRSVGSILARWIPHRLADALVELVLPQPDTRAAELTREHRRRLVQAVKQAAIPIAGTLGFRKAEVTAGGVALNEVDSHTMQSRLVPNLYFAGELLDLDGPIGGFNFQAAFSTGALAGESV